MRNLALAGVQIALKGEVRVWQHHNCIRAALKHRQQSNLHQPTRQRGSPMHTSLRGPGRRTVDRDEEMVRHRHHRLGLRIAYRGKFPFPTQRQALMKLCKLNPGNAPVDTRTASVLLIAVLASTYSGRGRQADVRRMQLDCSSSKDQRGPIPNSHWCWHPPSHCASRYREPSHPTVHNLGGKKIHPQRRHNTGLYPGGREVTDEHSAW